LVGVIDTAVARAHPRLAGAVAETRSFAAGRAEDGSHGTQVAYVAARHGARVTAADVFAADRAGRPAASADAIVRALDWLVARRVPVLNLSIEGPPNAAVALAVRRAQAAGVLVVAAAGNGGPAAPPAYPAAYPGVVAVTAVDDRRRIYRYANQGPYVSFAAPGVDVVSAAMPDGETRVSGSSFAAPVVASLLAARLRTPDARSASTALASLRASARDLGRPGRDPVYGWGLIEPASPQGR
jgi:subtilisin family serine protease